MNGDGNARRRGGVGAGACRVICFFLENLLVPIGTKRTSLVSVRSPATKGGSFVSSLVPVGLERHITLTNRD
jgi:hypothetical protein